VELHTELKGNRGKKGHSHRKASYSGYLAKLHLRKRRLNLQSKSVINAASASEENECF
jgi:hypothetical protein